MNTKLSIPFLAVVLLMSQGCIIIGGGGGGRDPGDVTFNWTFVGQTCAAAGVSSVHITIPGESLANDGNYPCISNGYPGIVLHDFAGGVYTYNIEGLDAQGYSIYVGSGTFTIDGNVLENVDLTPNGQASSYALVSWRFPGNVTCANADTPANQLGGVAYVDVVLDGAAPVRLNCVDGSYAAGSVGVSTPMIDPGQHTLSLTAVSSNVTGNYPLFRASGTMTTTVGTPVSNLVDLQWAVGGVVVDWTLYASNGTTQQSCSGANNPTVYVQFINTATTTGVYPSPGDPNPCTAAPTRYFYLPTSGAGTNYAIAMGAGTLSGATWTMMSSSPIVTVQPGIFPPDLSAVNLNLRQN